MTQNWGNCLISSHVEIIERVSVSDHAPSKIGDKVLNSEATAFPGLSTYYKDIYSLTPNTLLNVETNDIERIFPREPLKRESISDELINDTSELFTSQLKLLSDNNRLMLSLSAGIDSRVSLAAATQVCDDIICFTGSSVSSLNESRRLEFDIAHELCERIGFDHETYVWDLEPDKDFRKMFQTHTEASPRDMEKYIYIYIYNYINKLPRDRIEIRSNVAEVGRVYYRKKFGYLPKEPSPQILTKLYGHVYSDNIRDEFERNMNKTKFSDIYNYDSYDIFYWEWKMGRWLSSWLLQKDISHDTFIPFNNRILLRTLLSVPYKKRKSNVILFDIIDNLSPQLLEHPVNPQKESSLYKQKLKRRAGGLAMRQPLPIYRKVINYHRS